MPWADVRVDVPIPGQGVALSLADINRMFYEGYPRRYFRAALQVALAAYQDPTKALSPLSEPVVVKGEPGEGGLEVQVSVEKDDIEAIREAARLQIAGLYYHALETFIRLFLAHAPGVECPWMQLIRDEGPPFTEKLKRVEQYSDRWVGAGARDDEHVRLAFFPVKAPGSDVLAALGNAKSWLRFAAHECRDARMNNSLKHGVSLRSGEPGLAFYPGTDPRTDPAAKPAIQWTGEALIVLARVKQPDRSEAWVMEHRKLSIPESLSIVFLVQRWIQALLDVGELRYLGRRPSRNIDVPSISYEQFIEKTRVMSSPAWSMASFTMPIGWADFAPPKARPSKHQKS